MQVELYCRKDCAERDLVRADDHFNHCQRSLERERERMTTLSSFAVIKRVPPGEKS